MDICRRCVLPGTFPGLKFSEAGICQCCETAPTPAQLQEARARYTYKFLELVRKRDRHVAYDALVALSGGKDSTYMMKMMTRDFGLRALAVTFDNGFISEQALKNIQRACNALRVDRVVLSPAFGTLRRAFVYSLKAKLYPARALERATAVCNTCMHFAKALMTKMAIEMKIPLITFGWSPGQAPIPSAVMALNVSMIRSQQNFLQKIFEEMIGEESRTFLLQDRHYAIMDQITASGSRPVLYNVHPLAFFDYDEAKIRRDIQELGWEPPRDTDSNSTNCLLNAFAIREHLKEHGFHPYAMEIAGLVRSGLMTREEGLQKLLRPPDEAVIDQVRTRLGIGLEPVSRAERPSPEAHAAQTA